MRTSRTTPDNTLGRQNEALAKTVSLESDQSIFRARRNEATARWKEGRYGSSIKHDEPHCQQAGKSLQSFPHGVHVVSPIATRNGLTRFHMPLALYYK